MEHGTCKRIVLKLTGEIFLHPETGKLNNNTVKTIAAQIKELSATHQFGIVMGGGNFFRGTQHGAQLGITPSAGHQVGMLATMMNGTILRDLFEQNGITTTLLSAVVCPQIGTTICQQSIEKALQEKRTLIFVGGTGNPFFTTDTNAVLRALQIDAAEIWKGTDVDGIYSADPNITADAKLLKQISYDQALEQNLAIMDATAFTLARQHKQRIRIFNIFEQNALIKAAHDEDFGSTIY
jgi:uridylate kinase